MICQKPIFPSIILIFQVQYLIGNFNFDHRYSDCPFSLVSSRFCISKYHSFNKITDVILRSRAFKGTHLKRLKFVHLGTLLHNIFIVVWNWVYPQSIFNKLINIPPGQKNIYISNGFYNEKFELSETILYIRIKISALCQNIKGTF